MLLTLSRLPLVLVCFVELVSSRPAFQTIKSLSDLPNEYQEILPAPVREFIGGLSDADKAALAEVAKNHAQYTDIDKLLEALKEKSPDLYERAVKLHEDVREKFDALSDEAKKFAEGVIGAGRKIHSAYLENKIPSIDELKEMVATEVEKYKALSVEAKENLDKNFPVIAAVFKNEKFQAIAQQFLKKD